jgi:hypothetical protein
MWPGASGPCKQCNNGYLAAALATVVGVDIDQGLVGDVQSAAAATAPQHVFGMVPASACSSVYKHYLQPQMYPCYLNCN